jgi:hypothetical protein
MNERRAERVASRWGALLVILCTALLIEFLPQRYHLVPTWFAYLLIAIMVIPMLAVSLTRGQHQWRRVERGVELMVAAAALFLNSSNLVVVAYNLIEHPGVMEPVAMFYTSLGIWSGNVLVFTLIYWLVDGGGPDARINGTAEYPDFDFPTTEQGAPVRPGWQPGIVDYLFLAFTTNTAFSPTEAMPMTARAKVLVMVQSSISLITIAIVAARTINILK